MSFIRIGMGVLVLLLVLLGFAVVCILALVQQVQPQRWLFLFSRQYLGLMLLVVFFAVYFLLGGKGGDRTMPRVGRALRC